MMKLKMIATIAALTFALGAVNVSAVELAVNGDFETGDLTGWEQFPTAPDQISIISPGASGNFAVQIDNAAPASAALIKNANVGIGIVEPGMDVTISIDARGTFGVGGVAFAEFFSELEGGGTSQAEILGGAPLALTQDWQTFEFTTTTGPDVGGGVTLQLTATTGGDPASFALVEYDNISITVEGTVATEATTMTGVKALFQ
jgi:hypothetical protein